MPRPKQSTPAELTPQWPEVISPDPEAEVARKVALVLLDLRGRYGLRELARGLEAEHGSIKNVMDGKVWPSLQLVSKLERALGRRVWPNGTREYRLGEVAQLRPLKRRGQ